MAYNLVITNDANDELDKIVDYIAVNLQNPKAASDFLDQVESSYDLLIDNPRIYQLCDYPTFKEKQYRKVVINNYIMIYKIDETTDIVNVMHFFYGKRDYYNMI
ncbi:MAG: type II toxin-antitoxin system RelE/ParE family toxin [Ruminococcus sp.]|nr:type II toxin-antitoxin system RelE/ParE family toxin [Ruminococcus sp.]